MSDILVDGLNEIIERLNTNLNPVIEAASQAIALEAQDRIAAYPSPKRARQPFSSDKQRRGFFAKLKSGQIQVPYRRGASPGSQSMGRRWQISAAGQYGRRLTNTASYSGLVQSKQGQAGYHKGTWSTDEKVAQDIVNDGTAATILAQGLARVLGAELMNDEQIIAQLDSDADALAEELEAEELEADEEQVEDEDADPADHGSDQKAANYSARVGQVIAGRLTRGGGGRFSSAGAPAPAATAPKPPAAAPAKPKPSTTGKKPKQTPEDKAKQKDANTAAVFGQLGITGDMAAGLFALAKGEQPAGDVPALLTAGLAVRDTDGQLRLTPQGRTFMLAAAAGDAGRARDALSLGKDRAAASAEQERKKKEKEEKAKSGGGGGGGGGSDKPTKEDLLTKNRAQVATALEDAGIDRGAVAAFFMFVTGSEPTEALAPMVDLGLLIADSAGGFRLSKEGRALDKAAKKGDTRAALDALSAANDRMVAAQNPSTKGLDIMTDGDVTFWANIKAIKAGGKRHLEVKVAYGTPLKRDSHQEYFSPATDFDEEHFPTPPATFYHGFDENGKATGKPIYTGTTIKRENRADGHYLTIELKNNTYADRTWNAALKGQAVASPATVAHLRRRSRDGHLDYWPIAEIAVWDDAPTRRPANRESIAIPVLKALYAEAGLDLPAFAIDPIPEATPQAQAMRGAIAAGGMDSTIKTQETHDMTPEEIQAAIAAAIKKDRDEQAAAAVALKAQEDLVTAAVKAERDKWEAEAAKTRRLPDGQYGQAPAQARFADVKKYDHLDGNDTAFLVGIVNSKPGQRASDSAYKALAIKMAEGKDAVASEVQQSMKAAGIDPADFTNAAKANELNYPTQAGYGDEWAAISYSSQVWEAVRAPATIVSMIPEIIIPQGSESVYDPLEGADPNWYKVGQTTDLNATTGRPDATVPSSKLGTDRVLHTATKVGGRVVWNGEMEEDSIVPYVKELRRKLEVSAQEVIEHLVIDGDTDASATTNINLISGTPGATAVYLSFDGFRKLALITNTANALNAGGLLYDTLFLDIAKLMGTAGLLGADKQKTLMIIDPNVMWKILTLTSVKTRDVFNDATIENGNLTGLWGYKVNTSFHMHKQSAKRMANTAGKINGTDSSNTTGSILAVRPDQWKLARKRKTTIETSRYPEADANQIVVTLRAGLKYRDTEAAAIAYNVGV